MAWATGKRSHAISDRSGMAFPYQEMVREWTGSLVHTSEFEPKHPQIRRKTVRADAVALQNTRSMDFQQPTLVNGVIASTGGQGMMTANLTLPGQFAFNSNGMQPDDGAAQNRNRGLNTSIGSVTISIT